MKHIVLLFVILVMSIVFFACASKSLTMKEPVTRENITQEGRIIQEETWEVKWKSILIEGKKEGSVVIYSTLPSASARQEITKAMKNKYGINLEILAARGAELAEKLLSQRRNNLYLVDVYLGGPTTALSMFKPRGILDVLEPMLILPEVVDPKYWLGGNLAWVDKDRTLIGSFGSSVVPIAINTTIIKPEEIKSYYDLLDPKWKGKIIINDPSAAGTGFTSFHILGWYILNPEFFYQLVKQEPVVVQDRRLMHDWLARGKYPILLFPYTSIVKEFKDAGAPLEYVIPREGTYLSSGGANIGMINKAPHPDAAKVFINFLLSKEGQTIMSINSEVQSLRIDVPTEGLDPKTLRQQGVKYFLNANTEEIDENGPKKMEIAREIFAPFLIK